MLNHEVVEQMARKIAMAQGQLNEELQPFAGHVSGLLQGMDARGQLKDQCLIDILKMANAWTMENPDRAARIVAASATLMLNSAQFDLYMRKALGEGGPQL